MVARPSRSNILILFLLFSLCAAFTAATYIVGVETLVVRSGKGSMYPVVGKLLKNDTLNVVKEDADDWLLIRVGEQEGFVKRTALVAPKGGDLSALAKAAGASPGNAQASDVGSSAAAAGLRDADPVAISYAQNKNLDPNPLGQLLTNRERVAGVPWGEFARAGRVGPYKN